MTGANTGRGRLERDDGGEYGFRQIEGRNARRQTRAGHLAHRKKDLLKSNAALDAYFAKHRLNPADREFDVILRQRRQQP
jgi:adenine-specific DNA-methyltransferase